MQTSAYARPFRFRAVLFNFCINFFSHSFCTALRNSWSFSPPVSRRPRRFCADGGVRTCELQGDKKRFASPNSQLHYTISALACQELASANFLFFGQNGYFFAFPRRRPLPAVSKPLLCNRKRAGACPLLRFTSARPFCLRCRCSFG